MIFHTHSFIIALIGLRDLYNFAFKY